MDCPIPYSIFSAPWYHNTPPSSSTWPSTPTTQASLTTTSPPLQPPANHPQACATNPPESQVPYYHRTLPFMQALFYDLTHNRISKPSAKRQAETSSTVTLVPSFTSSTTAATSRPYSPLPAKPTQPQPIEPEEETHLASVWRADALVRSYIFSTWSHHADYITIECDLTLPSLCAIGRLPRDAGVRACRGLVRVPAVHEELANGLWEFLRGYDEGEDREEVSDGSLVARDWWKDGSAAREGRERRMRGFKRVVEQCRERFMQRFRCRLRKEGDGTRANGSEDDNNRVGTGCPFCPGRCIHRCSVDETGGSVRTSGDDSGFWQREEPPGVWSITAEASESPAGVDDQGGKKKGRKRDRFKAAMRRRILCGVRGMERDE